MPVEKAFKSVTADDGTVSYVEITDATELPVELVKANPEYVSVLDQSVKRRKIIQDLKKPVVVTNAEDTEVVTEVPKTEEKPVVTPPILDKAALFAEFRAQLATETQAEQTARETRQKDLAKILSDNGLSASLLPALETSTNPGETAKLLAKSGYRFDDIEGGEVPTVKSATVSSVVEKWKEKYTK